jgi:hypothetical protein
VSYGALVVSGTIPWPAPYALVSLACHRGRSQRETGSVLSVMSWVTLERRGRPHTRSGRRRSRGSPSPTTSAHGRRRASLTTSLPGTAAGPKYAVLVSESASSDGADAFFAAA